MIRARGLGRQAARKGRSKLEERYAEHLKLLQLAGEIADFREQAFRLRLAGSAFYKPDFLVILADGLVEFHETKGHWEEAARVRIKVAAELYPWFTFKAVQFKAGNWVVEEIGSHSPNE